MKCPKCNADTSAKKKQTGHKNHNHTIIKYECKNCGWTNINK